MPIKFPCPNCPKVLTAPDELAGQQAVCTGCKKPLTIPAPSAHPPPPAAAKPDGTATPPPRRRPNVDVDALAASILADKKEADGAAQVIAFTCEYCDA